MNPEDPAANPPSQWHWIEVRFKSMGPTFGPQAAQPIGLREHMVDSLVRIPLAIETRFSLTNSNSFRE